MRYLLLMLMLAAAGGCSSKSSCVAVVNETDRPLENVVLQNDYTHIGYGKMLPGAVLVMYMPTFTGEMLVLQWGPDENAPQRVAMPTREVWREGFSGVLLFRMMPEGTVEVLPLSERQFRAGPPWPRAGKRYDAHTLADNTGRQ